MRRLSPAAGTPGRVFVLAGFPLSFVKFRLRLLCALRAGGSDLHLAAPGLGSDRPAQAGLAGLDCTCHDLPLARTGINPLRDIVSFLHLLRLLRRTTPTHFLAYTAKPVVYGLLAARLAGVPHRTALITGLGYLFGEEARPVDRVVRACGRLLYRLALAQAGSVIFQNADDRELFIRRGLVAPRKAGLVNGSGVALDEFRQQALPPDDRRCHFLMIARLLTDKGIREYVAAARRLRPRYPQSVFHLAGWIDSHPCAIGREELQAWIDEGVIVWHGRLDDVRAHLAACHVYVLPSYREGTPRTVLEAMATGRPAVTTDTPGCRQTVVHGRSGLLVPARDPGALADALGYFLQHPQRIGAMGDEARRHVQAHYDVDAVNQAMLRLMRVDVSDSGKPLPLPGKRLFDLCFAALALLALSPVLALVALLVRIRLGAPVIFRQQRPGQGGQPFTLYKFRSMTNARDAQGNLLPDARRLTRFGRFLRRSSLDELPELINVLRGDMSLVGPRPLLLRYLPYFTERERLRLQVRPGITGWAQIHGRNNATWSERLARDVWYVENRGMLLDLTILARTVASVLRSEGVVVDAGSRMRDLDVERAGTGTQP